MDQFRQNIMLDFPLNPQEKGSIENAQFKKLKALNFIGGLPVFTAARDVTINKPMQGEMWLEFISSSMRLNTYYNGNKYSSYLDD